MAKAERETDEFKPEEEFDIALKIHQGEDSPDAVFDITVKRLKEFSFYLVENVEFNLNHCLDLLEERPVTKKSNTLPATVAGVLSSAIPMVGKGVGAAVKEGEIFILNKIDKKNSRLLSSLVHYFGDNRETIRQTLVQAAIDLFYCFEQQFTRLTCEGGHKRAMQKLAKDATNRIFTYLFENPPSEGDRITKDDFTKAVILGNSKKNTIGIKKGRTLFLDDESEEKWTSLEIYTKVGLYLEETNEYFKNHESEVERFGFRRTFDWEDLDETWKSDETVKEALSYQIKKGDFENLQESVRLYVISKNVNEEAKLDRELKHEESQNDRAAKQQCVLQRISEMMTELNVYYQDLLDKQEESTKIVKSVKENNENKLEKIHQDVIVTQEGQVEIQQSTEEIKQKMSVIESAQEVCLNAAAVINSGEVQDVVKELNEVKNVMETVQDCKKLIEKTQKIAHKSEREVNRIQNQAQNVVHEVKEAKLDQKVKQPINKTKLDKKIKKLF